MRTSNVHHRRSNAERRTEMIGVRSGTSARMMRPASARFLGVPRNDRWSYGWSAGAPRSLGVPRDDRIGLWKLHRAVTSPGGGGYPIAEQSQGLFQIQRAQS